MVTNDEKVILENLPKNFKYIARNKGIKNDLYLFETKQSINNDGFFNHYSYQMPFNQFRHIFDGIEDGLCYEISKLKDSVADTISQTQEVDKRNIMKLKDLEDGKEYRGCDIRWKIVNDTLFCYSQDDWRVCQWKYNELLKIDFEEVFPYVSLQEAIEHMKKGRKAKFYYEKDAVLSDEYHMTKSSFGYYVLHNQYEKASPFCDIHQEPKWILL